MAAAMTVMADRNFARTISHTPTGAVSSRRSVPCRYSSENSRMVISGMRNISTTSMLANTAERSLDCDITHVAKKYRFIMAKNAAR